MRYLLIFLLLLPGCIGTEAYYQAQTAYYQAQAAAVNTRAPLAEMITPDGTIVRVANPNQINTITPAKNPIVETIRTVINSTPVSILAGGWAARELISASNGDINNTGTGSVTNNSGNSQELNNADAGIDKSITTDDHSAVAEPVIVEPQVVHVEPVVVDQVIVRPEIITVPAPGGE